jgi:hypothetical protein
MVRLMRFNPPHNRLPIFHHVRAAPAGAVFVFDMVYGLIDPDRLGHQSQLAAGPVSVEVVEKRWREVSEIVGES